MLNTGFEQPDIGSVACYRHTDANVVPGWSTTQPAFAGATANSNAVASCPGANYPAGSSPNGQSIELWANGGPFGAAVFSREGTQHSELNSYSNARLFQNVCLLNGESVPWTVSHRGLAAAGSGTFDVAEFRIGAIAIARMRSNNLSNGSVTVGAAGGSASWSAGPGGWSDYAGTFAYTGATGVVDLGFGAISTSNGGLGGGNHLDAIQVNLRPFVEFQSPSYGMDEARPTLNIPRLRVAGTVPAGGMNVPVTITGGTATLGVDYTTPGNSTTFDVFIPAGVYDLATFTLPITLIDDGAGDPDETITFSTPDTAGTGAAYNLASLDSCGAAPQATTLATLAEATPILPRIQLNKALASSRATASDQFQLRLTGSNGGTINTTGTGSTIANGTIQVAPAAVGTSYTLSEVMAPGSVSVLSTYAPSISCTNTTMTSTTVLPSGAGSSFTLVPAQGDNISCTITNRATTAPSGLSVVKSVTSGTFYASVGDTATYSYVVTNTGGTNLTNLAVTDNRIATVNCGGITALAPGGNVTCSGSYTVTQADVDAAIVTNIVQATARNPSNQTLIATDDAVISLALPSLALEKATTSGPYASVGEVIPYTYRVHNDGNVTIHAIAVTDNKIPLVNCPQTTLIAGQEMTCTANYTVTQADLDAGALTNVAQATGTPVSGVVSPVQDQVTVPATAQPSLSLVKNAVSGAPYGRAGDTIGYEYVVTNTGNVTINALTVTDDRIATVSCPVTTLAPDGFTTCTASYPATQADVDAGSVTNNASAGGTPAQGTLSPATDSETVAATAAPALTLDKRVAAGSPYDAVGDVVSYTYLVLNSGNVTINAIAVTDDRIATVSCPLTTLAPDDSTTCTGSYTITQADVDAGAVTNNASATGTPAQGTLSPATDSAVATSSATPALTLEKNAVSGAPYDEVGDVVSYEYLVANPSSVTINAISVTDDRIATVSCPLTTLAPGGSMTCTASYTVTQADLDAGSVTNNAIASGVPTAGTLVPGTDSETVDAQTTASMTMDKVATSGSPYGTVGDVITYEYTVTNTGNVVISALAVTDDRIATVSCPVTTLAPDAFTICTASYTVTQLDLDAGAVTNIARATGTVTQGTLPAVTDTETVGARAGVSYGKAVNTAGPVAVGQLLSYALTVTVRYAPTSAQLNLVLTDTLGAGLTFDQVTTPGIFTCTQSDNIVTCALPAGQPPGTYRVGYTARVNAQATGTVSNTVTATSGDPNGPPPSCAGTCTTSTAVAPPVVSYGKVADTAGPVRVGDTITYTLRATVSQSQTTAVTTLTDTLGTGLTFGTVTNAGAYSCTGSGSTLSCTLPAGTVPGTYDVAYTATVTNQAAAGGTVDNAVSGSSAGGTPPTCSGACAVAVNVAAAVIEVAKLSDPGSGAEVEVGQTITYTLTATISNAALNADLLITDTPSSGLTIGPLPAGCVQGGDTITCTLPPGTVPGTYTFIYPATINDEADAFVNNSVLASSSGNLTTVTCTACGTQHAVAASDLRIGKAVAVRTVRIGDLVRYTLTVQNLGGGRLRNGTVVDTPPAGFTYVAGSLVVDDTDDAGTVEGFNPVRFGGLDIAGGETARLVYLMRVGAGVRPGMHENRAQAFSPTSGEPISNVATAQVQLVADPLLDDSLIFGTVFNDCDGDGEQDADEPGIPGVRIVSVDGLMMETDRFGRYHLAGIAGGAWERGRNFILKVDRATLAAGAELTTDNPLVRRITPGVPVRFDWGVKRCVVELAELQLGTVLFAPGSAQIPAQHLAVIERMAATVREHRGGEVVIAADGEGEALALARAQAVQAALAARLDSAAAQGLLVSLRTEVTQPATWVAGLTEGGPLLGMVLFDTDEATIRPEFNGLLGQVAQVLEQTQGGTVTLVGHTDVRASREYNAALGLRRAKAVQEALSSRLSSALRERVRVDANPDPDAARPNVRQ